MKYAGLDDQQLSELLKKGDRTAYTQLFHRYKAPLFRHAYNLLHDGDEAEDVIQDVFMVLWSKRDRIAVNTSVSAFLYRAVRNRVLNILSHQKVVSKYTESISRVMEEGCFLTDEKIREKELSRIIELEIEALPPKMRQVFLLNKEYGLSYKEIGEQLRISDKTAKLQVANAIRILKGRIPTFISLCVLFFAD